MDRLVEILQSLVQLSTKGRSGKFDNIYFTIWKRLAPHIWPVTRNNICCLVYICSVWCCHGEECGDSLFVNGEYHRPFTMVILFEELFYYHPRMRVGNVFGRVCLSVCPSVCLSVCLSVRLSVCLSVCSDYNFWTASHRNFIFGMEVHLDHI